MYDTALHEILNILDNIDRFGFMPNGARTYYVTRTQPPVAAIIVRCVYEALAAAADDQYRVKAEELLKRALPTLVTEFDYFETHRTLNFEKDS